MRHVLLALVAVALLAPGCLDNGRYTQSVAVLVDLSGTYSDERKTTARIVKTRVLPDRVPGDEVMLVRIDDRSYESDNIDAQLRIGDRPSKANAQKLAFSRQLDAVAGTNVLAPYTDISGALMLTGERLQEADTGSRVVILFTDLVEDLPDGAHRDLAADELSGIHVLAINVKRLNADNVDPAAYRERLEHWRDRVTQAGAEEFQIVQDPARIPEVLSELR